MYVISNRNTTHNVCNYNYTQKCYPTYNARTNSECGAYIVYNNFRGPFPHPAIFNSVMYRGLFL